MKIKQEDGTEVEVFTAEELQAKTAEAVEEAKKGLSDEMQKKIDEVTSSHTSETEELKEKLSAAEAALQAAEDGDAGGNKDARKAQIERLRQERDEAQKLVAEKVSGFETQLAEIHNNLVGNVKTDLLNSMAGQDKDLRAKLELAYDDFAGEAKTKEEITERMGKAYLLATGDRPSPGALDSVTGMGSGKGEEGIKPKAELSDNAKAQGKILGVSEEDRAKYGPGGEKDPNREN